MENPQLITALHTVISPVVMISGVGMLVLSMTNRFSHATNRARALADRRHGADPQDRERIAAQLRIFYRRLRLLHHAIALALGSVLFVAFLILALLANYLFDTAFIGLLVIAFAISLLLLVVSLVLFICDTSLSLAAMREELRDVL